MSDIEDYESESDDESVEKKKVEDSDSEVDEIESDEETDDEPVAETLPASMYGNLEEDDEEEEDENYLQKFDESIKNNVIADHHPELVMHNSDEVAALARVVRNEHGEIIDPLHRTLPFITKYEKARCIGERTQQINAGAKIFVTVDESMIDSYLIALKEFEAKKIPFIIKRPLPNGGVEYWRLKDLEILS